MTATHQPHPAPPPDVGQGHVRSFLHAGLSLVCPRPDLGTLRTTAALAQRLGLPTSTEIADGGHVGTSPTDTIADVSATVVTLADLTAWLGAHATDPDSTPLRNTDEFYVRVDVLDVQTDVCAEHSHDVRTVTVYTDPECLMYCIPAETAAADVAHQIEQLTSADRGGAPVSFVDAVAHLAAQRFPATALVDGIIRFCRSHPAAVTMSAETDTHAPPATGPDQCDSGGSP